MLVSLSVLAMTNTSVRIARHHSPLSNIHPKAQDLALVGICLENPDDFTQYYHRAFEYQNLLSSEGFLGPLTFVPSGVDTAEVRKCLANAATWETLNREMSLGDSLRLRATPSFIIRGRLYTGSRSTAELRRLIEDR